MVFWLVKKVITFGEIETGAPGFGHPHGWAWAGGEQMRFLTVTVPAATLHRLRPVHQSHNQHKNKNFQ
jgi:hypothetical protein